MSWRQRFQSLLIVYDLDNPRRRFMDYCNVKVDEEGAERWAKWIAEVWGMERYGYVLYHRVCGSEKER